MPLLVQLCIVIVTLAFVAIAVATILSLLRLVEAAGRMSVAAQDSMTQLEAIVQEAHDLLLAAREIVPPAQRIVKRFERLGERAADLSTAVFDEIEQPVVTAVAVARGVKTGGMRLFELFSRRFAAPIPSNNGDQDDE